MTLAELIAQFRTDTADDRAAPLFSDANIKLWLNEAVAEAAIRASLIHEASAPAVCQIAVVADTARYAVHEAVVDITHITLTRAGTTRRDPLVLTDRIELDRVRPDWRACRDDPRAVILDDTTLTLDCLPRTAGTINLECHRIPLTQMTADSDKPEINAMHHMHLVQWAMYRGFMRPDADSHDPGRGEVALDAFTRIFGIRPDADLGRSYRANVPAHNKAYW